MISRLRAMAAASKPIVELRRAKKHLSKSASSLRKQQKADALRWIGFHPDLNRMENPLCASPRSYWSQADEDGILEAILRRIEAPHRFLEIGVGDGLENNTLYLLALGWSGAWIGDEELAFQLLPGDPLTYVRSRVVLENLMAVVIDADVDPTEELGVVSIDVDGNDYHFSEVLLEAGMRPAVWIVEYNGRLPVGCDWVMPYASEHRWDGSDYFGASLFALSRLMKSFGYRLVACSGQGANAFFVSKEYANLFEDCPSDELNLYRPPFYYFATVGHRKDPRTVEHILRGGRQKPLGGSGA